jgi:hypothetical protein
LVYYGTANPGPWNSEGRPGQNYWLRAFSPVDLDTGEAVWFYQTSPHDMYDYDGVNDGRFHAVGTRVEPLETLSARKQNNLRIAPISVYCYMALQVIVHNSLDVK